MKGMNMIDPTPAQMEIFLDTDQASPVIFVNCHRYFSEARYPGDYSDDRYPVNVSGRDAYHRYFKEVSSRFVHQVGGRLVLAGPVDMVFIGEGDWDEVIIGHYPSKAHAMQVPALPGYDEIVLHRKAGLEVCQTMVMSPQNFLINTLGSLSDLT
jgi:uncharacterized protein (DUF1330 family)